MSRNGETPKDPRHALIGCLDSGQTGCLVGRSTTGVAYRVYVMLGEVLAAQSDEDDARLLAILQSAEHVDPVRLDALRERLSGGTPLSEALFDALAEELLQELLFERFRENLYRFLTDTGVDEFVSMDAVFVENIQVGHDSRALLDELVTLAEHVGPLEQHPELVLAPGAVPAAGEAERAVLERCGARMRLGELLRASPWEATRLLAHVQRMLDEGALIGVLPTEDESISEEDTADAPLPGAPPRRAAPAEEEEEPPTTQLPRYPENTEEEDLAAFQDYDTVRGGGSFLTDRTLLDRVDLDGEEPRAELVASTETLIEMEDAEQAGKEALKSAVSLNFSGPKLHETEIQRKLEVANEVLATIAQAIERTEGRGAGAARLQLLVEGTSVPLAPLFKNVELAPDGRLPVAQVMKNLRKRPAGEHRRLLNRGLADLIERALSAADEVLDVDGFEAMLERLAGYQQRLGV